MAPPTSLAIKTGSVVRLMKEEAMYHRELATEQSRLAKLEAPGSDADEYAVKQQKKVVEETASVIPEVRVKIKAAVELLEFELAATADTEPAENKAKAAKAIADGKALLAATAA